MGNMVVRHVGLGDGSTADVLITDGVIVEIGPELERPAHHEVVEANGRKAYPGFVDGHSHMDKSLVGMPWYPREAGRGLLTMIEAERDLRASDEWDYDRQISRNIEIMLAAGTLHTRAFVDIDTQNGLVGFEAMLRARETYAGLLDMQIVAFGQSGTHVRPGTAQLMEDALAHGADAIGGMDPCMVERDPVTHVKWLFSMARKYDKPIDVHLHEPGSLGAFSAELILDETEATGMQGRVTLSHAHFLGGIAPAHQTSLIARMADLDVRITNNAPSGGPMANLPELLDAGVVVAAGCDGVCDSWAPLNHSDMLFKGYQLAAAYGMTADDQLERVLGVITTGGATAMGLAGYGVTRGSRGDLVLLDVDVHVRGIVDFPKDRLVIRAGKVIAEGGRFLG